MANTLVKRHPFFAKALFPATLIAILAILMSGTLIPRKSIYWGALVKGATYGLNDAPWNTNTIEIFEAHTRKQPSILHWGQSWWDCYSTCDYQRFDYQVEQYNLVRERGYIPLVDWASWDYTIKEQLDQPNFSLRAIIDGRHDPFLRQWAGEAKRWGQPFFLRFNWEMNGSWYPWSEKQNGNAPGEFVQAWRHVHDIFRDAEATNVTWVWCPVALYPGAIPLERLYPGDAYVDWTCVDGYNWGAHPAKPDRWRSFYEVFSSTYRRLLEIAPDKPIMIAETASTEIGGSKAEWITDALINQLPNFFPKVKALVWFNWSTGGMDWVIESSSTAQEAFAQGIASPYYATNEFAQLSAAPIPPLEDLGHPLWLPP
jgi:mannan endo-1,4-beta-mannosidase